MSEVLLPYELYALIQSIVQKNLAHVVPNPTLRVPGDWINDFTGLVQNTPSLFTSVVSLPLVGSYSFQVSVVIQPNGGAFISDGLELRLYRLTGTDVSVGAANYDVLQTFDLTDPLETVYRFTILIQVVNALATDSFALGYWANGGSTGSSAGIRLTVESVGFTQITGIQQTSPLTTIQPFTPLTIGNYNSPPNTLWASPQPPSASAYRVWYCSYDGAEIGTPPATFGVLASDPNNLPTIFNKVSALITTTLITSGGLPVIVFASNAVFDAGTNYQFYVVYSAADIISPKNVVSFGYNMEADPAPV